MPAPVVGAERGGASPGGEPAAHLEDAGGRGAGRHQPHLEDARNPPSRGVPPGRRDGALGGGGGAGFRVRRDERSCRSTRRKGRGVNKRGSLEGKEELSGRRSERDEKNLREMSEREVQKN